MLDILPKEVSDRARQELDIEHRERQLPGGLRKQPLQDRSKAAIRRVLDAATEIVLEEGPEALSGSPQLLLDRSGVSRGSLYAFFETPERVLDELALQIMLDSRDWVRDQLEARSHQDWLEIIDIVMDYYELQFRRPLVRKLWVGQQLTTHIRRLDRIWADEFAQILLPEFKRHSPKFADLTVAQCVIAVEVMERLGQYAFRDGISADGDGFALSEARRIVEGYFRTYE